MAATSPRGRRRRHHAGAADVSACSRQLRSRPDTPRRSKAHARRSAPSQVWRSHGTPEEMTKLTAASACTSSATRPTRRDHPQPRTAASTRGTLRRPSGPTGARALVADSPRLPLPALTASSRRPAAVTAASGASSAGCAAGRRQHWLNELPYNQTRGRKLRTFRGVVGAHPHCWNRRSPPPSSSSSTATRAGHEHQRRPARYVIFVTAKGAGDRSRLGDPGLHGRKRSSPRARARPSATSTKHRFTGAKGYGVATCADSTPTTAALAKNVGRSRRCSSLAPGSITMSKRREDVRGGVPRLRDAHGFKPWKFTRGATADRPPPESDRG